MLLVTYAAPIAAALTVRSLPERLTALPRLAVPGPQFPLLEVPRVHKPAPLAPLPRAAERRPAAPVSQHVVRKVIRTRIAVVSDRHSSVTVPDRSSGHAAQDEFAALPVVEDTIGTPVELPAEPAQPDVPAASEASFAESPATESAYQTQFEVSSDPAPSEPPDEQTESVATGSEQPVESVSTDVEQNVAGAPEAGEQEAGWVAQADVSQPADVDAAVQTISSGGESEANTATSDASVVGDTSWRAASDANPGARGSAKNGDGDVAATNEAPASKIKSEPVAVSFGDFVQVTGNAAFSKSKKNVKLTDGSTVTAADVYTAALDDGSVFAGADNGSGKRAGFSADIASAAVAVIVDRSGNREWQSVIALGDGELVGVPSVSLSSEKLRVVFNGSATDGTAVDFAQSDPISVTAGDKTVVFDGTQADAYVAADGASISLLKDVLVGTGDVIFRSVAIRADLDMDAVADDVQLVTLGISNASLTISSDAFALTFNGDLLVADVTSSVAGDSREWLAVQGSGLDGSLTLAPLVTAEISEGVIELNQAIGATPYTRWSVLTEGFVTVSTAATTISGDLTSFVSESVVQADAHFDWTSGLTGVELTSRNVMTAALIAFRPAPPQASGGDPPGLAETAATQVTLAHALFPVSVITAAPASGAHVTLQGRPQSSSSPVESIGLMVPHHEGAFVVREGGPSTNGSAASQPGWAASVGAGSDGVFAAPAIAATGARVSAGGASSATVATVQGSGSSAARSFEIASAATLALRALQGQEDAFESRSVVTHGYLPASPPARGPPNAHDSTRTRAALESGSCVTGSSNEFALAVVHSQASAANTHDPSISSFRADRVAMPFGSFSSGVHQAAAETETLTIIAFTGDVADPTNGDSVWRGRDQHTTFERIDAASARLRVTEASVDAPWNGAFGTHRRAVGEIGVPAGGLEWYPDAAPFLDDEAGLPGSTCSRSRSRSSATPSLGASSRLGRVASGCGRGSGLRTTSPAADLSVTRTTQRHLRCGCMPLLRTIVMRRNAGPNGPLHRVRKHETVAHDAGEREGIRG